MNYKFITPEGDYIQGTNPDGSTFTFNQESPHYAVYLNSGQTADAYVAPANEPVVQNPLVVIAALEARITALEGGN